MTDRVRKQVLGYLLEASDDSERELVEARLQCDPAYRGEILRVRRELPRLEEVREPEPPPPGLAWRTCQYVFAQAKWIGASAARRRRMTPHAAPHAWTGHLRWLDAGVAAAIVVMAVLVVLPAVQGSRFQARLIACQDNLRQLGVALTDYSRGHGDYFPQVPAEGKLAAAGVYAPLLVRDGLLTEPQRVLCPESPGAAQAGFRIPSVEELQAAGDERLPALQQRMGGSYGYCLGHWEGGSLVAAKNCSRAYFALMADAPSDVLPGRQSLNHDGRGQNVLFEDGHVEFAPGSQPQPGGDDIFANDEHCVAAGIQSDDSVIATSGTPPIIPVNYR